MRVSAPSRALTAVCLASLAALSPLAGAEEPALFSNDGYRIAELLAPVPDSLAGAVTVDTTAARNLVESGDVVLIDVLPAPSRPEGLPPTVLWMPPERRHIPGSAWLPNVGYGRLSDALEAYFRENLLRLSGGDLSTKLIIYCLADCWMSWNAARRAVALGYKSVYWYPEGTSGWEAEGLPLVKGDPVPQGHSK